MVYTIILLFTYLQDLLHKFFLRDSPEYVAWLLLLRFLKHFIEALNLWIDVYILVQDFFV